MPESVLMICDTQVSPIINLLHSTSSKFDLVRDFGVVNYYTSKNTYDVIVIDILMESDLGLSYAKKLLSKETAQVLFLINREDIDLLQKDLNDIQKNGALIIEKPYKEEEVRRILSIIDTASQRYLKLQKKYEKLQAKLKEVRLIDRAKLILMQYMNMSEEQAHKFIAKQAMNLCQSLSDTAQNILRTYESANKNDLIS